MNPILLYPPPDDFIEVVAERLKGKGNDLSKVTVVFPGRRPALYLTKRLTAERKTAFILPQMMSIEGYVHSLATKCIGAEPRMISSMDAIAILFELFQRSPLESLVKKYRSFSQFYLFGSALFSDIEEVLLTAQPVRTIAEKLKLLNVPSHVWLAQILMDYIKKLDEAGKFTQAMLYRLVLEQRAPNPLDEQGETIIAGVYSLYRAEMLLLAELAKQEQVTIMMREGRGIVSILESNGIPFKRMDDGAVAGSKIEYYQSPDFQGQVFALSRLLKERREEHQESAERTVVVLPSSDALIPVFQNALSSYQEDEYNISMGYPVSRSPISGFLSVLFRLVKERAGDAYLVENYLSFLLHPYIKNMRFGKSAEEARILVHAIEEYLIEHQRKDAYTLDEIESLVLNINVGTQPTSHENRQTIRDNIIRIHNLIIRPLTMCRSMKDYAAVVLEIIATIRKESTASHHPLFNGFVDSMETTLQEVINSSIADQRPEDRTYALALIEQLLNEGHVPFPGTPLQGLQVLGLLETRALQFDNVYILDVNEGVLPGVSSSNGILTDRAREAMNIPTQQMKQQAQWYYFDVLIGGAKNVHLFYQENDEQMRSRFIEALLWNEEQRNGMIAASDRIQHIGYAIALDAKRPDPILKSNAIMTKLGTMAFSASSLNTYLRCQIRFYYEKLLHLEEKETIEEPDQMEIGNILHEILRIFYEPFVGKELIKRDIQEKTLQIVIDRVFEAHYGTALSVSKQLIKRQMERQLKFFLKEYQLPQLEGCRILIKELESKYEVSYKEFKLSGRIDRIEERNQDIVIIDYKTSSDDTWQKINMKKLDPEQRETYSDALKSVQLPFYALLYSQQHKLSIDRLKPKLLLLGNKNPENIETGFPNEDFDPIEAYSKAVRAIDVLIAEINNGSLPFAPPQELQKVCPSCPFRTFCGTQWVTAPTW